MTEQRLTFEAWFADSRRNRGAKHRPNFDTLADGTYADDHTQRHWWTWQSARARMAPLQERADALQADFRIQNKCIADQQDEISRSNKRADALEAALRELATKAAALLYDLSEDHGDDHFEPECNICRSYKELSALVDGSLINPTGGES